MAFEKSNEPEAFRQFEQDGWDSVGASYAAGFARLTEKSVPALLDVVQLKAGDKILDVCCGPARLCAAAIERGAHATGLDLSAEFIEMAKKSIPGAAFIQGDVEAMPFDAGAFDCAVSGYGIIHCPDPIKALEEMKRVVKPGGHLAVSVWAPPAADNGFGVLYGAIKAHGDMSVPLPSGPDFFQFSQDSSMRDALGQIGLTDISTKSFTHYWHVDHPVEFVDAVVTGTVRARGLLLGQTDEVRRAINQTVIAAMGAFESPAGGYDIPMPTLIGSGCA